MDASSEMSQVIAKKPYFRARQVDGELAIDGETRCLLGYRLGSQADATAQGIFAEWSWDGTRLTVCNDRYGFYPCFYFRNETGICVSPSLVQLLTLGAPRDFDDTALAVFLRLGLVLGEDTPFKAIRMLPPGTRLQWQVNDFHLSSAGPVVPRRVDMAYEEALDCHIDLFRQAIRRHAPPSEDFVVPLSGGRDSRHILLELHAAGYRPRACVTQKHAPPPPPEYDVEPAALLCKALGIEHVTVEQSPSRLSQELTKNLLTHFCADEHAWIVPLANYMRGRWRYAYDGLAGDILAGSGLYSEAQLALMREGRCEELARQLLGAEGYLPYLLSRVAYRRFSRERAMERLKDELRRYVDAASPLDMFCMYNRTRREIALSAFNLFGDGATVLAPYLDHDFYDFMSALPASMLFDSTFHDRAIRRAYPQYAHVPYSTKSESEVVEAGYYRRFAWEVGRYALREPRTLLVNRLRLVAYLSRCLVARTYSEEIRHFGPLVAYLVQLERVTDSAGGAASV
jgi:asparagine synthetase B (glutamine-hydrolysing)